MTRKELTKLLEARRDTLATAAIYQHKNMDDLFQEGHDSLVPLVLDLVESLQFYAQGRLHHDTPNVRLEFGCGCCVGNNDNNGDNDYDKDVAGLTAREALEKFYKEVGK